MTERDRPRRPSGKPDEKRPAARKPGAAQPDRPQSDRPRSDPTSSGRPRSAGSADTRRDGPRREKNERPRPGAARSGKEHPERSRSDRPRSDISGSDRPRAADGGEGERRPRQAQGDDRRESTRGRPRGLRPGVRRGERPDGERRSSGRSGPDRTKSPREGRRDVRSPEPEELRHDDPPVSEDSTPSELDRAAWRELKALTKENAEWVAGHLVMASRVVDEDPERAHRHAQAAARRAGRIPVVRETLGITAYLMGDFALALRELRTYRRLSGSNEQLPLMVDCERGLGRPERALELAGDVERASLPVAVQVELAIARSGARLDLGQVELALAELNIAQLTPDTVYSFSPALFDSYAVVLSELGRDAEAKEWGKRANIAAEALAETAGGESEDTVTVVELDEGEQ